ncbi:hypothetical protein E2C01_007865 [Portunus trituberculatus]|uniref:Uncharacterized protein n=1 Tax=Portunus trituberculatus TaxID=210409 RepID=A0A5B7CZA5_PORTR|nr:hypothetical protein [Portunus trituberculatus]
MEVYRCAPCYSAISGAAGSTTTRHAQGITIPTHQPYQAPTRPALHCIPLPHFSLTRASPVRLSPQTTPPHPALLSSVCIASRVSKACLDKKRK